jgi:hypothetical protein
MHILDAPENMLTFHNMDQLFETRPVPRSGPVAPSPIVTRLCPMP